MAGRRCRRLNGSAPRATIETARIGAEPSAVGRGAGGEASAGERIGQPLSRERCDRSADAVCPAEGDAIACASASVRSAPCGVVRNNTHLSGSGRCRLDCVACLCDADAPCRATAGRSGEVAQPPSRTSLPPAARQDPCAGSSRTPCPANEPLPSSLRFWHAADAHSTP